MIRTLTPCLTALLLILASCGTKDDDGSDGSDSGSGGDDGSTTGDGTPGADDGGSGTGGTGGGSGDDGSTATGGDDGSNGTGDDGSTATGGSTGDLPPQCAEEPEVGPCDAAFPKYFFNPESGACEEFIWGGCDGNVPFETMEECQAACE